MASHPSFSFSKIIRRAEWCAIGFALLAFMSHIRLWEMPLTPPVSWFLSPGKTQDLLVEGCELSLCFGLGIALSEIFRFCRRFGPRFQGEVVVFAVAVSAIFLIQLPRGPQDQMAAGLMIILLPWSRLAAMVRPWGRRYGQSFFSASLVVPSFALILFAWLQVRIPGEPTGARTSPGYAGIAWVTSLLGFRWLQNRVKKFTAPWQSLATLISVALPLLPFLKLVLTEIDLSQYPEAILPGKLSVVFPASLLLTAGSVLAAWAIFQKRRKIPPQDNLLAYFSVPLLLYVATTSLHLFGPLEAWHDGKLFSAAQALLAHQVFFDDTFVPYGLGTILPGVLAMKVFRPTIATFRLAYQLLAPWVPVLHYLLFLRLIPGRRKILPSVLLTFLSCELSGFLSPYPTSLITWMSGLKLILPLATFISLSLSGKKVRWVTSTLLASLALFLIPEVGAALSAGILFVWLAEYRREGRTWKQTLLLSLAVLSTIALAGLLCFCLYFGSFGAAKHEIKIFVLFLSRYLYAWGLPLFSPLPAAIYLPEHFFYLLFPLFAFSFSAVALWRRRKDREQPTLFAISLGLLCFSVAIYQIGAFRSDTFHLRVGLGLTGALVALTFLRWQRVAGTSLLLVTVASLNLAGPDWSTRWESCIVKSSPNPERPLYSFDPGIEGPSPVLTFEDWASVRSLDQFFREQPSLEKAGVALSERTSVFSIFFGWRRFQGSSAEVALMDPFTVDPSKGPRYAKWPSLSHLVNRQFFPCRTLFPNGLILVRRDLASPTQCSLDPRILRTLFPPATYLGHFAEFLGNQSFGSGEIMKIAPDFETLQVRFAQSPIAKFRAVVRWNCEAFYAPDPRKAVFFDVEPRSKNYLIPLSSNPAWAYCPVPFSHLSLYRVAEGREVALKEATFQAVQGAWAFP